MPCKFYWDGNWTVDSLCVQCAETIKTIHLVARRYPIPGLDIETGFAGKRLAYSVVGGERFAETLWRNAYAKLKYGDEVILTILLSSTPWGGPVVTVKEEEPVQVSNILAAWSLAKMVLARFRDPEYNQKLLADIKFPKVNEVEPEKKEDFNDAVEF